MKRRIFAIALTALLAVSAIFTSSCTSCFSDSTISGTKYELLMISDLPYTVDENNNPTVDNESFKGAVWKGIKDAASTEGLKYRYFEPAKATVSDSKTYLEAYKETVNQQMTLAITAANMDNKPVMILPGNEFVPSYMQLQESSAGNKALKKVYTLIVGASSLSDAANTAKLHEKCYTMVIDYTRMAYAAGYTAVNAGYTKLGYLGYDDTLTKVMLEGMILGAEKAAADKGLAAGSVEIKYSYATSPDDTAKADGLFSACDIVMGENAELESLLKKQAGEKAVIGVTGKIDGAVQFSYYVSDVRLSEIVKNALQTTVRGISTAVVTKLGIAENIFNYKAKDGFSYISSDAEALMQTIGADGSIDAKGELTGLTLTYVTLESK